MRIFDHVLIVDFDQRTLLETTALFEHHGFDVKSAGSIDDVLRALEPGAPRVIVMDPVLPDRDGFELCRSMLDSCIGFKPIVVMASTRITGHEPHFRAKEVGAHMFIERPKQDELLIQAVTTVMQAGGSGPDPSAPGRTQSGARVASPFTDADEPAPVLDPSFAEWVERTFTPGGIVSDETVEDAHPAGDPEDDEDSLCLDALDELDRGGEPLTETTPDETTSSVADLSAEDALAVANRASVIVSDAMRPTREPRGWGGALAVGLAALLTIGGAIAWFVINRRDASLDGVRTAASSVSNRFSAAASTPAVLEVGFPEIADENDAATASDTMLLEDPLASDEQRLSEGGATAFAPTAGDSNQHSVALGREGDPGAETVADDVTQRRPARQPLPVVSRSTEHVAERSVESAAPETEVITAVVDLTRDPDPDVLDPREIDDEAAILDSTAAEPDPIAVEIAPPPIREPQPTLNEAAALSTLRAALDPLGANPETAAAPGLPIGWPFSGRAEPSIERTIDPPVIQPAPPQVQPVVVEPSLQRRIAPRYPPAARRWGRGGRVMLKATVDTDGTLRNVRIVDEPSRQLGFGRAALDAVEKWVYEPATLDGVRIERPISIEVTFRP